MKNSDPDKILKCVTSYFDTTIEELNNKSKKQPYIYYRQMAHTLLYESSVNVGGKRFSTIKIGQKVGCKTHSTVLHSIKTIHNLIDTDKTVRYDYEELNKAIKNNDSIILMHKNDLFNRHYLAIRKRGKIKDDTTHHEFIKAADSEDMEAIFAYQAAGYTYNDKVVQEKIDAIAVRINELIHAGYDFVAEYEKNTIHQETRED